VRSMVVTTETGSVYDIDEYGICVKKDKDGILVDAFKPYHMAPVPEGITTLGDIYNLPQGEPVIGQRFYISGKDGWWLATRVVSVSYDNKERNG